MCSVVNHPMTVHELAVSKFPVKVRVDIPTPVYVTGDLSV